MMLWHETLGSGPDLVLLHGWGMNAAVWEPLLPGLSERYRVTRLELPGHGQSDPLDGGLDDWASACLDAAPARASWVGWSLGGLLAQHAAVLAPERFFRLCQVTATPSFVRRPGWPEAMDDQVFQQFAQALLDDPAATLKRFLSLQVKGAEEARTVLRTLNAALARRRSASAQGLETGLRILREGDLRESLPGLEVPSHWLFGERDTLVPGKVAAAVAALQPAAEVEVVERAGHAPWLSHPQQCLAWLEKCCG